MAYIDVDMIVLTVAIYWSNFDSHIWKWLVYSTVQQSEPSLRLGQVASTNNQRSVQYVGMSESLLEHFHGLIRLSIEYNYCCLILHCTECRPRLLFCFRFSVVIVSSSINTFS